MIVNKEQVLAAARYVAELRQVPMAIQLSYQVSKLAHEVAHAEKQIIEDRFEILKKHGYDGSEDFIFPEEKIKIVNSEIAAMLTEEIEIPAAAITLSSLLELNIQVPPIFLDAMMPFTEGEL